MSALNKAAKYEVNNFIIVIQGGKFQREQDEPLEESYGNYDWNTTFSVFSRAKRLNEFLYHLPEQDAIEERYFVPCPFWSVGLRGRLALKWEMPHCSPTAIDFKLKRNSFDFGKF